jgi:LysR family transcriptional regulator for metE and metH
LVGCADAVIPLMAATEEDLARIRQGSIGRLLISLECHSCVEWLAPAMAAFRRSHPHIDLDLRFGSSFDPLPSLSTGAVDLVITGERSGAPGISGEHLFRYQIVAAIPEDSPLAAKKFLEPGDFAGSTIITYPVAECRLDLYTRFLEPAGVVPARRRTAELTAMIIQWVASDQGMAALPSWALTGATKQVSSRPLGRKGLWSDLYALRRSADATAAHLDDFVAVVRQHTARHLEGIQASELKASATRSTPGKSSGKAR